MNSSSTSTAGADHHLSTTVATTNNRSLTTPAQPPRPSTTTIPQPPYPSHQQQSHFTTTTTRISNPNNPSLTPQKQPPPPPQPPQGILYPIVSSSGRGGFVTNRPHRPQLTDQTVTVANSGGAFPPRSLIAFHQQVVRPFGFSSSDSSNHHHVHMMRPPFVQQHPNFGVPNGAVLLPVKGVPVSPHHKVASSPSTISDYNGYNKEMRDRSRDDACITIRDRKVKISDGTSLYALCRSWLRNGYYEESQPKNGEGTRSLPRPLPIPMADSQLPKKRQVEEERDEEDVQQLSAQELLQRHVKRAKRVRARLREERLQRIARYKARLATLLPQQEQFTDDTTAAN